MGCARFHTHSGHHTTYCSIRGEQQRQRVYVDRPGPAGAIRDGGGRIDELVSLVDLPPTLLDAAGIIVPAQMEGRSILPLTRGEAVDWPDDIFIQISESQIGRAIRTSRWKYSVSAKDNKGWILEQDSEKYDEEFLYDLVADPHELTNLIGFESHQKVADLLRERLLRYIFEIEGVKPEILAAPIRESGQRIVTYDETRL